MMKMSSKYKIIISLVLAVSLMSPMFVLAENSNTAGENATENNFSGNQGFFCQNVEKWANTIETRLEERENIVVEKVKERDLNIANRRANRDENLGNKRNNWDVNREARYTILEEKAETDEQKQAVSIFKNTVDAAVVERRASIDSAIASFRTEVNKKVIARRQAVSSAVAEFKSAVAAAGDKAKADCSNGVAAATVRQNYRANLKAARDKFQADKKAIDKIGDDVQALAQIRNEAGKQAINAFTNTVKEAAAQMKASF